MNPRVSEPVCHNCNGSGEVETIGYYPDGSDFDAIKPCSACKGTGRVEVDNVEWNPEED